MFKSIVILEQVECCQSLVWGNRILVVVLVDYLKRPSDF
jgi:hypothetical protein